MDKFFGLTFHLCWYSIHHIFFEIPSCGKPFSDPLIYFIEVKNFAQNDKFSNENDMFSSMKELKKNYGECNKHK